MNTNDKSLVVDTVTKYILAQPDATSREVAEAVYDVTGIYVSHVTVLEILHNLGYLKQWKRGDE
jgi:t-SNARE complex subunit (syntaxin)